MSVAELLIDLSNNIPVIWITARLFFMIGVAVTKVKAASEQLESVTETEKIGKLAFEEVLPV